MGINVKSDGKFVVPLFKVKSLLSESMIFFNSTYVLKWSVNHMKKKKKKTCENRTLGK